MIAVGEMTVVWLAYPSCRACFCRVPSPGSGFDGSIGSFALVPLAAVARDIVQITDPIYIFGPGQQMRGYGALYAVISLS